MEDAMICASGENLEAFKVGLIPPIPNPRWRDSSCLNLIPDRSLERRVVTGPSLLALYENPTVVETIVVSQPCSAKPNRKEAVKSGKWRYRRTKLDRSRERIW